MSRDRKLFSSTNPDHKFGTRILQDPGRVFEQNAWDHADWTPEQEAMARKVVDGQVKDKEKLRQAQGPDSELPPPCLPWNSFYSRNENRFFKDRHWLPVEFPELISLRNGRKPASTVDWTAPEEDAEKKLDLQNWPERFRREFAKRKRELTAAEKSTDIAVHQDDSYDPIFRVLECGCGTGSTVFPLLEDWSHIEVDLKSTASQNGGAELEQTVLHPAPTVYVNACDFAETAVELVKSNPAYSLSSCNAFVFDLTSPTPMPLEPETIDVVTCIFVLSALDPSDWNRAVTNITRVLRPGGVILFRDYARYDLTQLRFKSNRLLKDSLYTRGDGTMVYFFAESELPTLFPSSQFAIEHAAVDRRLMVEMGGTLVPHRGLLRFVFISSIALLFPIVSGQKVLSVLQSVVAGSSGKTSFSNIGKFVSKIANSPALQPILESTSFDGVITVFAPIDSAWESSGYDQLDDATLAEVLKYHVAARDLNYVFLPHAPVFIPTFLGFLSPSTLTALSPQWIFGLNEYVSSKVMGNFSTTGGPPSRGLEPLDAFTSDNALVYVMSTVLQVPPTVSKVLSNYQSASTFLSLLASSGLQAKFDSLASPGGTFFIPINDGISSFGNGAWDIKNSLLPDILQRHVVVGTQRPLFAARQADPVALGPFPEGLSGLTIGEIRSYSTLQ
ncbi:Methyltransferase-like protein 2-A [Gonapodya sp. JEL0774]|nr:Methyltransferase-like protein 2-A [Gonapodya sp. JEL0774]